MKRCVLKSKYSEYNVFLTTMQYVNGRMVVEAVDEKTTEPIATLTINLPNEQLFKGETFFKNHSENEGMLESLESQGIVVRTGREVISGFVKIPVVKWKL